MDALFNLLQRPIDPYKQVIDRIQNMSRKFLQVFKLTSGSIVAPGSTEPVTEMSTGNPSWG
jgi:hypothetical protein